MLPLLLVADKSAFCAHTIYLAKSYFLRYQENRHIGFALNTSLKLTSKSRKTAKRSSRERNSLAPRDGTSNVSIARRQRAPNFNVPSSHVSVHIMPHVLNLLASLWKLVWMNSVTSVRTSVDSIDRDDCPRNTWKMTHVSLSTLAHCNPAHRFRLVSLEMRVMSHLLG